MKFVIMGQKNSKLDVFTSPVNVGLVGNICSRKLIVNMWANISLKDKEQFLLSGLYSP